MGLITGSLLFAGLFNLSFDHLFAHAIKSVIVMFVLYPTHIMGIPEVSAHPKQHYKFLVTDSEFIKTLLPLVVFIMVKYIPPFLWISRFFLSKKKSKEGDQMFEM